MDAAFRAGAVVQNRVGCKQANWPGKHASIVAGLPGRVGGFAAAGGEALDLKAILAGVLRAKTAGAKLHKRASGQRCCASS